MRASPPMALTCNIDARGKAVRLGIGLFGLFAGGMLLFLWALPSRAPTAWAVTVAVLLTAAFAVFEARAGWCVVRALGFRTRI